MRKLSMDPRDGFPQDARLGHRCGGSMGVGWATVNAGLRAANRRIPTFFPAWGGCRAPPRSPRCSTAPPATPKPRYFGAHSRTSAYSRPPNSLPIPRATWGSRRRTAPCKSPSTPRGPPFMPRSARSAVVGDAQITELAKVAELPIALVTESGKRGPFKRRGPPDAR